MQNLQVLIDMLTKGRKLHISILDLNGILNTPSTRICFENVIHSKKFCDMIAPIFEEINILVDTISNLTTQNDLLLPRLMSGKMEVE